MSYCHQDPVGIDFSKGFGIQPGALMRSRHSDCFCDNAMCSSSSSLSSSTILNAHPDHGNGATNPNAMHADWFTFTPSTNGHITLGSCGEGVDTRVWIWEGHCDGLVLVAYSDDDCASSPTDLYASLIEELSVTAGTQYFIEWDDRWSNAAFQWEFTYDPISTLPDCDGDYLSASGMITDTILQAKMEISSDAIIIPGSNCEFKAGQSIEFTAGFEISAGSEFTVTIEDCDN